METTGVEHFLVLLGRTSLEAGILVMLVLAIQWLFHRQLTPPWRCALWLLVAVRLVLPFSFNSETSIFNLLPRSAKIEFSTPAQTTTAAPAITSRQISPPPLQLPKIAEQSQKPMPVVESPLASALASPAPVQSRFTWSWPLLIFAIWLTGVLVLATHVVVSSFRLWRRCAPLPPLSRAWATDVLHECCRQLQLRNPPVLLESREVGSPALHGLFRPRLLLPKGFTEKFSAAELRFVFLHELAHLKRRDLLLNWLVVVLQIAHWFNPLVWFGFARWRAERELACDAMALDAAGEGQNKEYGRTILRLLDNFTRPMAAPGLVGILEDKSQLRRRIGMIASYVPTRGWPRLAMALIGVLAVIGLTDAQTGASSAANPPSLPSSPASSPAVPTPATLPPAISSSAIPAPAAPPIQPTPSITISSSSPSNAVPQTDAQPVISTTTTTTPPQKGNEMNTSTITNQIVRVAAVGLLALASPATPAALHAEDNSTAPATSELANQLVGAWVLVGTPGHVGKAPSAGGRIKFFTGTHWCITQADRKTGVVLFHHGGTYTLNKDKLHSNLEFANSSTMYMIGKTNGNYTFKIEGDTLTNLGLDNPWNEVWQRLKTPGFMSSPLAQSLTGTWAYVGKPGETNTAEADSHRLKYCAGGYWCDSEIDPKTGVVIVHHGGTCSLKDDTYVETCQYGNPTSMNLIGQDVKFTIKIEGNTLTLKGLNNPWNEVWKRL